MAKSNILFKVKEVEGYLELLNIRSILNEDFKDRFNVIADFKEFSYGSKNIIDVDTGKVIDKDLTYLLKKLGELSKHHDIIFITARQNSGIKAVNFAAEYDTKALKEMLSKKNSIIKTIIMTCTLCPEQYDCFDEYGNQVAYMRLRHGEFSVECPDCSFGNPFAYCTDDISGDGFFYDDDERISQLSVATDSVDNYYNTMVRSITRDIDFESGEFVYSKKDPDTEDNEILEMLYAYQQSNFDPVETIQIRKKGPTLGYHESLLKIIKNHRLSRNNMFPEANGANGLSEDHIEHELEFFKTTIDGFGGMVKTVNYLFDKKFEDFETYFRACCKKGWNAL